MNNDLRSIPVLTIRLPELFSLVLLWNGGYKGSRVVNTLYARERGASPFEIGLLLATYGLFALVLAMHAGCFTNSMHVVVPTAFGGVGSLVGIGPVFGLSAAVLGGGAYLSRRQPA